MALSSDDSDIRKSWLTVTLGGNGDYYLNVISERNGLKEVSTVRVSTSGGHAPAEVKCAVADLFRALEQHHLNEYPDTPEKEQQEGHSKISKLKSALQDKIEQFEAYKTYPRYQTEMEQNAVVVTLRELRYLDSIAEYE